MLIVDQLKKNDPQLRTLTMIVLSGLVILIVGLWWVQIVSSRDYQAHLETQSFRTVRIPAVRGSILDRDRVALAENRPSYSVSLYLDELRKPIDTVYFAEVARVRADLSREIEAAKKRLGRNLTREERQPFILTAKKRAVLKENARTKIASNVVEQVGQWLKQPLVLDTTNLNDHYERRLALPYPILSNLDPVQIARFEEQSTLPLGVDLEIQSSRVYPFRTTAAHVVGSLRRDNSSAEGEEAFFSYRLPDFRGLVGIEFGFDRELRGTAGAKSVLVNNVGYRQTENVWSPASPGQNVVLTLDLAIQQACEAALQKPFGPDTRGAAVVMDVNTGDLLALASSPTLDPNHFVQGFPRGEWSRISQLRAGRNRATQENYAPGSIFKMIVGLAALEAGLDPHESIYTPGHIYVGRRFINDTVPPGYYDFRRALKLSSNTYFITNGLRTGAEAIVRLAERLHLGQRTGLQTRQEVGGILPDIARVQKAWSNGDTANLSIGQGPVAVTPLQMAVMTAAIANGGTVLYPRLVDRIEPADPASDSLPIVFPRNRARNELGVKRSNLQIVQEAMLADVEDADGTGKEAVIPGFRICGKTGTAQVTDQRNAIVDHITWFVSYAPFEKPRYAVVVMIESGGSGGRTCAPLARDIYQTILDRERQGPARTNLMAVHR